MPCELNISVGLLHGPAGLLMMKTFTQLTQSLAMLITYPIQHSSIYLTIKSFSGLYAGQKINSEKEDETRILTVFSRLYVYIPINA